MSICGFDEKFAEMFPGIPNPGYKFLKKMGWIGNPIIDNLKFDSNKGYSVDGGNTWYDPDEIMNPTPPPVEPKPWEVNPDAWEEYDTPFGKAHRLKQESASTVKEQLIALQDQLAKLISSL